MKLTYSFEIKTVLSTQRQLPIIKLEAPYQMLFELGQFDTAEQAKNLWQGIEQGLKEPRTEPLYLGLNQIALDIYPAETTIHVLQKRDEPWLKMPLPTAELLRLLKDWEEFLKSNNR